MVKNHPGSRRLEPILMIHTGTAGAKSSKTTEIYTHITEINGLNKVKRGTRKVQ